MASSWQSRLLGPFFAACLLASPAGAQNEEAPGEPSEIDRDAARTLVQQGDERMKAKDYEAALVAYRRADDIMGVPTTGIEVGKVELLLGHLVEARAAFVKAASYPVRPGEPAPFTRARADARRQAAELDARIPLLSLTITGPRGTDAEVQVDGELVEAWASPFPVNPGPHELSVRAEGYAPQAEVVVLEEGETRQVAVTLEAIVTDRPAEPVPDEGVSLWPMAIAGASVAGAGLLVGAITGGLSLDEAATAKDLCNADGSCPPAAEDPLDRSRALAHVSTTSFVVAGVGAAVGVVGLVLSLDEETAAALRVGPGGAALRLRF